MKKIKPKEIVALEKQFNIVISEFSNSGFNNKSYYILSEDKEVISLSLIHNQISNITFLNNFPFLKFLNLSYNQILDISGVENLLNLESLNLSGNQISDITHLSKLINLKTLGLNNNFIEDATCLDNLSSLNDLNLSENRISELYFLCELPELINLNLSHNIIFDISYLENLKKIKTLRLSNNNIYNISVLEDLKEVNFLNLSNNMITDLSYLEKLSDLISLDLSKNEISNIFSLRDLYKLQKLFLQDNKISDISFLENLDNLESLDLGRNNIENISILRNFKNLKSLDLSHNLITNIAPLSKLVKISQLYINENEHINNISALKGLKQINYLNLSGNKDIKDFSVIGNLKEIVSLILNNSNIQNFTFLNNLKKLEILFLGSNKISDLSFLKKVISLNTLYLNYNEISDIDALSELKNITALYLQGNKISNIVKLKELLSLNFLDLTDNLIIEIEQFEFISNLSKLNIRAARNPCFNDNKISLDAKNNYDTILNYLKKIDESKKMYHLPSKVLFLGNSESGKSTLLDYILQTGESRVIKDKLNSTHIVQIETLPKILAEDSIPEAVFYDFGGQDYYHGLYKAFLSNDSINVLLWNENFDKNQIRKDRNDQLTRDYDRNYWLNQLKFQYTKEDNEKKIEKNKREPILLVQTHADNETHVRNTYKGDCESFNIKNEFFISLNEQSIKTSKIQMISLRYFEETLNDLIQQKQIIKKEPIWYKEFLNYILRSGTENYTLLSDLANEYKRERDPDNLLLPEVLRELSQTGLILYYKNDEDLKDVVWLDPSKTIQYIHESILAKDNIITKKGIVEKEILDEFADQKIVKLLINQKVIFLDEYENNYIIPGYLPLTEEEDKLYELLTFDFIEPNFILKFEFFIPFGLINQLICFYGKNKNKKHYWRDQLLFTKDNCKILIKLDFTNLEIAVSIKSKEDNKKLDKLERELFKDILDIYWDKAHPKFKYEELKKIEIEEFSFDNLIEDTYIKPDIIYNKAYIKNLIEATHIKPDTFYDNTYIENLLETKLKFNIEGLDRPLSSPDDLFISVDNKYFVSHKDLQNEDKTFNKIMSFGLEVQKEIQNDREVEIRKLNKSLFSEKATGLFKNFTNNKNAENMKRIFISYAKENKKQVNEFQKQIAPFKLTKEVETWHCSELELGEDWDSKIKSKFYEADIILYFVSVDFFSTPFILDEEVKRGIERSQDPNDKVVLIPIILEMIHWEDLLGKYSSNFKGKPIKLYEKVNNAWYQVVDDLKNQHFRKADPDSTKARLGQSKEKMKAQEDIIEGKL